MAFKIEDVKDSKKLFISEKTSGEYHWWIEVNGQVLAEGMCSELFLDRDPRISYRSFTTDEWIEYKD